MPNVGSLPALDTAIGLAVLFFLLATACSSINELIANVLGWRAKTLEDAIRNLLGDPRVKRGWQEWVGRIDKRDGAGITDLLFDHWRIRSLVRNPSSDIRRRVRPSYMPPRAFSQAVAEVLAEQGARAAAGQPQGDEPSVWKQTDAELYDNVRRALADLPAGQTRALLEHAAANVDESLEGFRSRVETAFDDAMERASGWYKRKVQIVVVLLAALIAIGLDVDSVHVANRLWNDAPTRTAVAAKAASQGTDVQSAADAAQRVQQLQLPIGWGAGNAPKDFGAAVRRIPGWIITIAALSLGAPFWFDLLSRLARLRGSGLPEKPRSLSDTTGSVSSGA